MKKIGICCLGLLFSLCSYAQVQREYHLISAEKIENKAYYFTALLREFGEVDSMICHDPVLKKMGLKKLERLHDAKTSQERVEAMKFSAEEITEAAKAFIKWFFSDDENMKMMAEIDKNNTCLLVKPSLKGLELNFDKDQLMKEDLSLFGSKRTEILDKWSTLMGDKGEE